MTKKCSMPLCAKISVIDKTGSLELEPALSDIKNNFKKAGMILCENGFQPDYTFSFELKPRYDSNTLPWASVTVSNGDIVFSASSVSAMKHLIYTYLKENWGSVWYLPDDWGYVSGKFVSDPFFIAKRRIEYTIPFWVSSQHWGESLLWHDRMRRIKDKNINTLHNWHRIIPPEKYFDTHPQYYSLINGERKPFQLCTSNEDMKKIFIAGILDFFAKNPGENIASLSPEDSYNFCECAKCRALDKDPGSITDRLMVFFNDTAFAVEKVYPNKKLAFYAYLNYTRPPIAVKPHRNLIPVVCHTPWEYCHNHSLTDKGCPANTRFKQIVEKWVKLSPEVYIREYYGHFSWYGVWPILHSIKDDIQFYKRIGIKGVISESHEHWGVNGWVLYGAGCYLAGETNDWQEIVDNYCGNLFPKTSSLMKQYITLLEKWFSNEPCGRLDKVFTPVNISKLNAILKKAEKALSHDGNNIKERELVKLFVDGFTFTVMNIDFKRIVSSGNINEAVAKLNEMLDWIKQRDGNKSSPAVVKYRLAITVLSSILNKYEEEQQNLYVFFNKNPDFCFKFYPIRKWLASGFYHDFYEYGKDDKTPMYPDFFNENNSKGLDTVYAPEENKGGWAQILYFKDFFSLSEYFPARSDGIRYYKKRFNINNSLNGVFVVRALDKYKIFLDGKLIYKQESRRFKKKNIFDFIKVDLSEGAHLLMIKLESSKDIPKDDFTVMLFDTSSNAVNVE